MKFAVSLERDHPTALDMTPAQLEFRAEIARERVMAELESQALAVRAGGADEKGWKKWLKSLRG